jgi:alcohol dehydrogenase class IV
MNREIAFEMAASSVRFGAGVTREVGMDLVDLGVRTALVVTDPNLTRLAPVQTVLAALDEAGVEAVLYDRVRVEPTDLSFRDAIQFAAAATVDGIVAVGGGSVIDTAKAVNLYTTYPPADFLDYVNAPIGKAMPVPGPLKPLIAIPTNPARHLQAAEALGANVAGAKAADAGRILADRITWFMERLEVPNGLQAIGYTSADIPALVEGTLPQHRVTKLSPRPAGPDELAALFEDAMVAW